jgi:hypothetical protein
MTQIRFGGRGLVAASQPPAEAPALGDNCSAGELGQRALHGTGGLVGELAERDRRERVGAQEEERLDDALERMERFARTLR